MKFKTESVKKLCVRYGNCFLDNISLQSNLTDISCFLCSISIHSFFSFRLTCITKLNFSFFDVQSKSTQHIVSFVSGPKYFFRSTTPSQSGLSRLVRKLRQVQNFDSRYPDWFKILDLLVLDPLARMGQTRNNLKERMKRHPESTWIV